MSVSCNVTLKKDKIKFATKDRTRTLRFLDSYQFLPVPLGKVAKSLTDFKLMKKIVDQLHDLPEEISLLTGNTENLLSLEEIEKKHITKILKVSQDLTEAARILGIDSATLWRKRKKYSL